MDLAASPNGAALSISFRKNGLVVHLLNGTRVQETDLSSSIAKYFEDIQTLEVLSDCVVLHFLNPSAQPFSSRGDASYRLCGIFAVLEILEDLSGLGWILETHSLHAFMGTKERRSTLYFRSGSVATRKSYSCLVETGKLRRLAVNKDQWSESMLEHLNFSLKDSYPRLKSGPSSQALVLVAMGEGAPEQWALLGDPLDTKLSHVCQFLTISIDYLQCAGFQIEGSLSLFADGMTIVLFSMDSSSQPRFDTRLPQDWANVFNLVLRPHALTPIVVENADPEVAKTLKITFYKNPRWKISSDMWDDKTPHGKHLILFLIRQFSKIGWRPLLALDGLGLPCSLLMFTKAEASARVSPSQELVYLSVNRPSALKMGIGAKLSGDRISLRRGVKNSNVPTLTQSQAFNVLNGFSFLKYSGHLKEFQGPEGTFRFGDKPEASGLKSMLRIFLAFTQLGWEVVGSMGNAVRGLKGNPGHIWYLAQRAEAPSTPPVAPSPPPVAPLDCPLPEYSQVLDAIVSREPPPPYAEIDPFVHASAPEVSE